MLEEALDYAVWRIRFGRNHGAVWRLCDDDDDDDGGGGGGGDDDDVRRSGSWIHMNSLTTDRHTAINVCDCGLELAVNFVCAQTDRQTDELSVTQRFTVLTVHRNLTACVQTTVKSFYHEHHNYCKIY